jgi:hypothetical protein
MSNASGTNTIATNASVVRNASPIPFSKRGKKTSNDSKTNGCPTIEMNRAAEVLMLA